jgi:hypothetical protein
MPYKASNINIIDIEFDNHKSPESVPYLINRNVLKQDELEFIAGYDRQKDSGKYLLSIIKLSL